MALYKEPVTDVQEFSMTHTDLLVEARHVLERYLFDGDVMRDDVASICMKIDDVVEAPAPIGAISQAIDAAA
jgi:hypothetical protein